MDQHKNQHVNRHDPRFPDRRNSDGASGSLTSADGMSEDAFLNSGINHGESEPIFFDEDARRYFQQHPEQLPAEYRNSPGYDDLRRPDSQPEILFTPEQSRNTPRTGVVPAFVPSGSGGGSRSHTNIRQVSTRDDGSIAAEDDGIPFSENSRKNPVKALGEAVVREYRPMSDRDWVANHARQATAILGADAVEIRNIRNTTYRTADDYTVSYFHDTYDLSELQSADVIQVPSSGTASFAHVEISFGFSDGRHLCFSIEARCENGESYDALGGMFRQYELIYVLADERDAIRRHTRWDDRDVRLYRLKLTNEEIKTMFVDMLQRANRLSGEPEFYHPMRNNCTSNIVRHINRAKPGAIPFEYRTFFSGHLDHLLYDLELVQLEARDFKDAREQSSITPLVRQFGDTEFFSAGIRQHLY